MYGTGVTNAVILTIDGNIFRSSGHYKNTNNVTRLNRPIVFKIPLPQNKWTSTRTLPNRSYISFSFLFSYVRSFLSSFISFSAFLFRIFHIPLLRNLTTNAYREIKSEKFDSPPSSVVPLCGFDQLPHSFVYSLHAATCTTIFNGDVSNVAVRRDRKIVCHRISRAVKTRSVLISVERYPDFLVRKGHFSHRS